MKVVVAGVLAACAVLCAGVSLSGAAGAAATTLHVAVGGDDTAAGGMDTPLRTLEGARDRIRALRARGEAKGAVTVLVGEGDWPLERTFRLEARDSGTEDGPVTYRAQTPRSSGVLGGRPITFRGKVSDAAVRARLREDAAAAVVEADLKSQGVTDFGKILPRGFGKGGSAALELFFNGTPMRLARWPNRGWMTIAGLPGGQSGDTITYEGERPARWTEAADPWLFGYWYHGWADQFLPVSGIDPAKHEIRLGARHGYGLREGQRFFALNVLEELDEPGEWYLDRRTGVLYFWPPSPVETGKAVVSVLDAALVELDGVSHVTLEGFLLEAGRRTAVSVGGGEGVTVSKCTIRNVGGWGVTVSGGKGHRVVSSDIHHTGEGGISLRGGDRKTLEPGRHEAADNHIHHFSRTRRTYQPAIQLGGVGLRAAHNLVHDGPHMALGFGGNDHTIECNEIHHVLTETDDAGAMYTGRDWTTRGHVIRYNFVHHSGNQHAPVIPKEQRTDAHVVYEPLHRHGTNLLYFDDAACGIEVYGNVLHGGGRSVMIGGGRDHIVRNNLIIGGDIGLWIDARGVGWARDHIRRGGGWKMYRKLADVGYDRPPYSERYPALRRILDEHPDEPRGNRIERNLFVGAKKWRALQGAKEEWIAFGGNLVIDAAAETPAEALGAFKKEDLERIGWEPIPLDRIGPRR